ncbi:MAG TPA: hypothetical protein VGQ49_00635 [Bryobacteraceae bacterium]|jgi:hypothetical protein|nr:hypothetical protein [Bryobacteraceae bacterium]
MKAIKRVIEFVTWEWLLTRAHHSNGSTVIITRAFLTAAELWILALALRNFLDPSRSWTFSSIELRNQLIGTASWFATIFAALYVGYYARFSSQWTYLAGVYNQIKAAECRGTPDNGGKLALADWKAGFIEDAEELHLATKPMMAAIISVWSKDSETREAFIKHVPGGETRLINLLTRIEGSLRTNRAR